MTDVRLGEIKNITCEILKNIEKNNLIGEKRCQDKKNRSQIILTRCHRNIDIHDFSKSDANSKQKEKQLKQSNKTNLLL